MEQVTYPVPSHQVPEQEIEVRYILLQSLDMFQATVQIPTSTRLKLCANMYSGDGETIFHPGLYSKFIQKFNTRKNY